MHKILEEMIDTVCLAVLLVGILSHFQGFFSGGYRLDCMEYVANSFLNELERQQKISKEEYDILQKRMEALHMDYEITFSLKCKRIMPQYKPEWTDGNCRFVYTGETKEETMEFSYEELLQLLNQRGTLVLERGDCIVLCIWENGQKRSLLQKIIRW